MAGLFLHIAVDGDISVIILNIVKAKTKTAKTHIHQVTKKASHHVKMAIVPHAKNQFRPHLIRRCGLVAVILVAIGIQFGYNISSSGQVLGGQTMVTVSSLLEQTNIERFNAGKQELKLSSKLCEAAKLKADDMLARSYWDHDAPDGTRPWKWLGDVGYYYDMAGENLAKNYSTTPAVMSAWMGSSEHKKNILKDQYEDVGFAIVDGEMDGRKVSLIVALYGLSIESTLTKNQTEFIGTAINGGTNIFNQFAVGLHSLTLGAVIGFALVIFAMVIAMIAHKYRRKLPKKLQKTWYLHHGLIKAIGLGVFCVIMVLAYNVGQI